MLCEVSFYNRGNILSQVSLNYDEDTIEIFYLTFLTCFRDSDPGHFSSKFFVLGELRLYFERNSRRTRDVYCAITV